MSDRVLSFTEVRARLGGISQPTLWRRIHAGLIKVVWITPAPGGKRGVRESDLDAYIASLQTADVIEQEEEVPSAR